MADRLQDKVIVVTGAASGFGRGISVAAALEGAKVVVSDIHEEANTVDDVASLAVFLASDESSYIHGDLVRIDGGETLCRYSV